MRKKAGIALFLLLFLLTACKDREETDGAPENKTVYRSEFVSLELNSDWAVGACQSGDFLYILDKQIEYFSGKGSDPGVLRQFSLDGSQNWSLALDEITGCEYVAPRSLQAGADGTLWIWLDGMQPVRPESPAGKLFYQIGAEGEVLSVLSFDTFVENNVWEEEDFWAFFPSAVQDKVWFDDDGWAYVLFAGIVYVFDNQQELRFSLESDVCIMNGSPFMRLSDGRIGCLFSEAQGPGLGIAYQVRAIDKSAQAWGEEYPLSVYPGCLYPGCGGYLFFVNSGGKIWGWDEAQNALVFVMDSTTAGTDLSPEQLKYFSVEPDGKIRMVTHSSHARGGELTVMTPVDPASLPERTTLTLACLSCSSSLRSYVNNFNRSHLDCQIELVEYSSDPHMPLEGYERMIVDITAGNAPDILCLDRLPVQKFGAKGLFEDLWPYIESDPELGRGALMSHVLECAEQDGSLYYIFDSFQIRTAAAPAAVAGDRLGWTLEDMEAALAQMPEGCQAYSPAESKPQLLYELLSANMGQYVDWETGTCAFDSAGFQQLLSYINSLDISPDSRSREIEFIESTILDGRQMLYYAPSNALVGNFYAVQRCEAVLGGPVSFCGDPTQDGSCGNTFYIGYNNCPLAMTGACKDKETAWSFLRTLLLPQDVDCSTSSLYFTFSFPINRENFELLARAYQEAEDPMRGSFGNMDGERMLTVEYTAVSAEEYGQIMELYDAIDSIYSTDEDLWEIVSMEAAVYFAGERSLEDVVERIQSRAQLYINEQR